MWALRAWFRMIVRARVVSLLFVAFLVIAAAPALVPQAQESSLPAFVYVKQGNMTILENHSLVAVYKLTHEPGVALVTSNASLGKVWATLFYADLNGTRVVGPVEVPAEYVVYSAYDEDVSGRPVLVLLVRSGGPENDTVVVIDANAGSIVMSERVADILQAAPDQPTAAFMEVKYSPSLDTLYLRTLGMKPVLSAVNIASPDRSWSYQPPHYSTKGAFGVCGDKLYLYTVNYVRINDTYVYQYNVTVLNALTGKFEGEETLFETPEDQSYDVYAAGCHALYYYAGADALHITVYNATTGNMTRIKVQTGATLLNGLEISPTGEYAAILTSGSGGGHELRVISLPEARIVYNFSSESYISPRSLRWSPGDAQLAFTVQGTGLRDTLYLVDLATGSIILETGVSTIHAVAWGELGKFYVADTSPTDYPRLYSYRSAAGGGMEIESESVVFHPGRVSEIVVLDDAAPRCVYFIDHSAYSSRLGYYDIVYVYKLVPAPVVEFYSSGDRIIGVADPSGSTTSASITIDLLLGGKVLATGYAGIEAAKGYIVILSQSDGEWIRNDKYGLVVRTGGGQVSINRTADATVWINLTSIVKREPMIIVSGDVGDAGIRTGKGLVAFKIDFSAGGPTSRSLPSGMVIVFESEYDDPGADLISSMAVPLADLLELGASGVLHGLPDETQQEQGGGQPGTGPVQEEQEAGESPTQPGGEGGEQASEEKGGLPGLAIVGVIVLIAVAAGLLLLRGRR